MLTLATLLRTSKLYAYNPSMADDVFLRAFLQPYVDETGVKARQGKDFYPEKWQTSRIMNGKVDVPRALRQVSCQRNLESRVADANKALFSDTLNPALFELLSEDILGLLDSSSKVDAEVSTQLEARINDPQSFMAFALIEAIRRNNQIDNEVTLWQGGAGKLVCRIGDLLDLGFDNRKKKRNIIAIPVDSTFETHVTRRHEGVDIQRVSENSIHGQWLTRMQQSGISEAEVKERIGYELDAVDLKSGSSEMPYPLGTIVPIDTERATYLLIAISTFNSIGKAESTRKDIEESIYNLLRYYDDYGQGADLYLPLIGSGLSRSGLDEAGSLKLIREAVSSGRSFIGGKITVVVRSEDARKLNVGL